MGIRQRRETGLADEVRLRGPDRGDIELVAAYDGHADADRAVAVAGVPQPQPVALVGESLVDRRDRLLEADADAGRLVVVVLVADRLRGDPGRLRRARVRQPRRD